MKDSYLLFRKETRTALVLITEDDDELYYLLTKLSRTRNKVLKELTTQWIKEFNLETNK